jgi:hypothetical protein
MTNPFTSKFVQLLQTFDEEELKAFDAWLRSPWCNSNKNLPRLLAKLWKYHPDFDNDRLTKEKLFYQVLPNGKFSTRRMNNLLSEACLAAEQFLSFERFREEESLRNSLLLEDLSGRPLEDWFFKSAYREIDRLEESQAKGWKAHLRLHRHYGRIYHYPSQEARMQSGGSILEKMNEQLELVYLLEKAAVINEMIARNRILRNERHDVQAALTKWLAVSEGVRHPSVDIYRLRFGGGEELGLSQYQALQTRLRETFGRLSEKDQKIHLLSLLNDGMRLVKAGRLELPDMLPLYQLGLQTDILLHEGKLSRNTYTTIVIAGNTEGSFDFTHQFIETFTPRLDEKIRDDGARWALAHTAYWKGEVEQSLNILLGYDFTSSYFRLIGRVLHTQTYFDLHLRDDSYREYLFSFLDAFEKWLSRDKVWSKANTASFLRFVQCCRKLARYYREADFRASKVENLLADPENIQALDWLRRKQEEVLRLRK